MSITSIVSVPLSIDFLQGFVAAVPKPSGEHADLDQAHPNSGNPVRQRSSSEFVQHFVRRQSTNGPASFRIDTANMPLGQFGCSPGFPLVLSEGHDPEIDTDTSERLEKAAPAMQPEAVCRPSAYAGLEEVRGPATGNDTDSEWAREEISQHIKSYFQDLPGMDMEGADSLLAQQVDAAVSAFVAQGCKNKNDVDEMLCKLAGNDRRIRTAFGGIAEVGYAAVMWSVSFGLVPKPQWEAAQFGAILGAIVGAGMVSFAEAAGAARDNHVVKLKPTGIAQIDRLMPSRLRGVMTVSVIGALCNLTKNSSRILASLPFGKEVAREVAGLLDTGLDTGLGLVAGAVAANLADRKLYPRKKQLLLAQPDLQKLLEEFNRPATAASMLKAACRDVASAGKRWPFVAFAPSTLVVTGYIAGMVAALFYLREEVIRPRMDDPGLSPDHMGSGEAAARGAVATLMMGMLALLAPMIASGMQLTVDARIAEWWHGSADKGGSGQSVSRDSLESEKM